VCKKFCETPAYVILLTKAAHFGVSRDSTRHAKEKSFYHPDPLMKANKIKRSSFECASGTWPIVAMWYHHPYLIKCIKRRSHITLRTSRTIWNTITPSTPEKGLKSVIEEKSSSSNVPLEMTLNYQFEICSMSIGASEKKIRQLVQTSLFCHFSKKG